MQHTIIKPRDRDSLIQALRAGVVPRTGQHLIQVGRSREIETLHKDILNIAMGGSTFRVVVGEYGAGKTFFLNLIRAIAMTEKEATLVVASADLNPERRLQATNGEARSLFSELMRNISTRAKPDGGAMVNIVEKFISTAREEAKRTSESSEQVITRKLENISELVNGYDFAEVIRLYCRGFEEGNDQLKADAIRWLRGEFSTKTDARKALGVRTCIDDDEVYDQLKLMAKFVRLAGYGGLLVTLDEMVNLYKLGNKVARDRNYEQILRMLNDSLQGNTEGLGLLLGGTPEFLLDTRRGLYSYEALQGRLSQNTFAKDGLQDFSGPVVRLAALTQEDFFVLLHKINLVFSYGEPEKSLLDDDAIEAFMHHCAERIGEAYFRTPRTTITTFINLLAILEQNPGTSWDDLIEKTEVTRDTMGEKDSVVEDEDLKSFTL